MRPLLLFLLLSTAACTELIGVGPAASAPGVEVRTVFVADGDSLVVEIDGVEEKVRLIGINAPEKDECFGAEARAALEALILDRAAVLVEDEEEHDQYGRLLRYVYVDGTFVNEVLVADGFAMARSYEPNTAHRLALDQAQESARAGQRGMWAPEACAVISDLRITSIRADAQGPDEENLNDEWIEIANEGAAPVVLGGWSVRDAESVNRYEFPDGVVLDAQAELRISTGCGDDEPSHLHWCSARPIWNNRGDVAFLLDPDGKIADRYEY